jgi:hypothetical protein
MRDDRLMVSVTFDEKRGYVGTAAGLHRLLLRSRWGPSP